MKTYTFRMIIEKDEDGYRGFVPILRGVHTWGKTVESAKKNLKEAIQCHLEGLAKDKEKIPQEEKAVEVIQSFQINA